MTVLRTYIAISTLICNISCSKISVLLGIGDASGGASEGEGAGDSDKSGLFPELKSLSPEAGAKSVLEDTKISVLFSEPIDSETLSVNTLDDSCSGTIQLSRDDFKTCVKMKAKIESSDGNKGFSVQPLANLAYEAEYKFKLTSEVRDQNGQSYGKDWVINSGFTVRVEPDLISPQLTSISPSENEIEQPVDSSISLTFSEAIDPSSIILASNVGECSSSSIEVSSNGFESCVLLEQDFTVSADGTSFTFRPVSDLGYGLTYKVKVKSSVKDLAGNVMGEQWTSENGFGVDSWRGSALLGSDQNEEARGMVIDSTGHIVVVGFTEGSLIEGQTNNGSKDFYVARYSPSGQKLWVEMLGTSNEDIASSVAVDGDNNIYVSGYTQGDLDGVAPKGGKDIFLTKYSKDGVRDYTKIMGTTSRDESYGITVCGDFIYLTGTSYGSLDDPGSLDSYSVFLIQADLDGIQQWARDHNSSGNDEAYSVSCGTDHVYLTGRTYGALGSSNFGGQDVFVSKYDFSGTRIWTSQLGSSASDEGKAVAVGPSGYVYVTGYTSGDFAGGGNIGAQDLILAKLDPLTGAEVWKRQIGTTSNDDGRAIVIDEAGYIYVGGFTAGDLEATNAGESDLIVLKFDPAAGEIIWQEQLGTPDTDLAYGMASFSDGIFVTGVTGGDLDGLTHSGGTFDTFVVKYSADGSGLE